MKTSETEQLRAWVENWKVLGPKLEELRRQRIRTASTEEAIRQFDLAFKAAIRNTPPRTTSGLVEFQRLLRKLSQK